VILLIISSLGLIHQIENLLVEHVKENYRADWDEDFITRSILKGIRQELNLANVVDFKDKIRINWVPYKLTGKAENKFGDIAILVNISYRDGDKIEGVAFLEAKKKRPGHIKFEEIRFVQLKRIRKWAPSSMILLYDYDDIMQFSDFLFAGDLYRGWNYKPYTFAVVIPTGIVIQTAKRDTTLYKFSLPFSYQLVFRYFNGLDLEFRNTPLEIAKGYARDKGLPAYLVTVSITQGKAEPEPISFNRELFTKIEE
jgi:hypothetical protein